MTGLLLPAGKPVQNLEKGAWSWADGNAQYETETLPFTKNDCLLLYTDGLIDAVNFEGKMWGKERLLNVLDLYRESSSAQLVHTILGYRRRFVGLASQFDDTSVLAIRKIE